MGGTGTFWFPVAPGITTLPAEPAIVDGEMNASNVVLPYNETAVYESRIRLGNVVTKFDYALELLTEVPALTLKTQANVIPSRVIYVPTSTTIELDAATPSIDRQYSKIQSVVPTLYTGTGSTQSVSNLPWQPGLVWIKSLTASTHHILVDSLRGASQYWQPSATSAELNNAAVVSSLDANGFTVGTSTLTNSTSAEYASWAFAPVGVSGANTAGTISTTVTASDFYSIATYTGTGVSGATIGHGLSQTPEFVLIKNRGSTSAPVAGGSVVGNDNFMLLTSTNSRASNTTYVRSANSTTITLGNNTGVNASGNTYVAYAFRSLTRLSKIGTYTGNGNSAGAEVDCGFAIDFLLVKRRDGGAGGWNLIDSARNRQTNQLLIAQGTETEVSTFYELTATGFIPMRGDQATNHDLNINGSTYMYMAFGGFRPTVLTLAADIGLNAEPPTISAT